MAFPAHKGTGWTTNTYSGTSGSVAYGAGSGTPAAGDLVICIIAKDDDVAPGTPSDGGATFQSQVSLESNNAMWLSVFAKIADGNEGTTVTFSSDNEEGVVYLGVFNGLYSATLSEVFEAATANTGSSTSPSSNTFSPTWGTKDTRWFSAIGWDSNSTVTAYPSNYTALSQTYLRSSGGNGAAGMAVQEAVSRVATSPSDSGWTLDDAEEWAAVIFGVRGLETVTGSFTADAVITKTFVREGLPATPQYVTVASNGADGAASVTVTKPAAVQDGDLLTAIVSGDLQGSSTLSVDPPAGWTLVSKAAPSNYDHGTFLFHKIADNEPASWTFTWTSGTHSISASVAVTRDAVFGSGTANSSDTASTSSTTASLAVGSAPAVVYAGYGGSLSSSSFTHDTDLTEISDYNVAWAQVSVGYRDQATATTVGPYTATCTGSTAIANHIWSAEPDPDTGISLDARIGRFFHVDARIRLDDKFYVEAVIQLNEQTVIGYFNKPRHITHVQVSSNTITKPAEVQEGDLLIAFLSSFGTTGASAYSSDAGWTLRAEYEQASQEYLGVLSKVATASEPSSYNFYVSGGGDYITTFIVARDVEWVEGNAVAGSSSGGTSTTATLPNEEGVFYGAHGSDIWLTASEPFPVHTSPYTKLGSDETEFIGSDYWVKQTVGYYVSDGVEDAVSQVTSFDGQNDIIFVAYGQTIPGFPADAEIAQGYFYVQAFIQKTVTGQWRLVKQIDAPADANSGAFGRSVALSEDGSRIVVGNELEYIQSGTSGAAWVFDGSNWETVKKLTVTGSEDLGMNVEITSDGTKIIVSDHQDVYSSAGTGAIYIFEGQDWGTVTKKTPATRQTFEFFGWRMALSADDSVLAVSSSGWDGGTYSAQGRIYAFSGTDWGTETAIDNPSPASSDAMGDTLAISDDGNEIVGGAQDKGTTGALYVFYGTTWGSSVQRTKTGAELYSRSVGVLPNDDVVATWREGSASYWEELDASDTWTTRTARAVPEDYDQGFPTAGPRIVHASDGSAAVGQSYYPGDSSLEGRAFIVNSLGNVAATFYPPSDVTSSDYFGWDARISRDGRIAAVCAPYYPAGDGTVFIYKYPLEVMVDASILDQVEGSLTADALISISIDALIGGNGYFHVNAVIKRTMYGPTPDITVDTQGVYTLVGSGTLASWRHSVADPFAFGLFGAEAGTVTTDPSIEYGELPLTKDLKWNSDDNARYVWSLGDISGRTSSDFEQTSYVVQSYRDVQVYSVALSSDRAGPLFADVVAPVYYSQAYAGNPYTVTLEIDAGQHGGILFALAHDHQGLGGRGNDLSIQGTGWTHIGKLSQTAADYWYKPVHGGPQSVTRQHSSVYQHTTDLIITVFSPTGFGFPISVDAVVYSPTFTVDVFVQPYFTANAYIVETGIKVDAVLLATIVVEPGFTVAAEKVFKRAFIDAVILKTQGADDELHFSVSSEITRGADFPVDALILRTQSSLTHYDDMSPDTVDTWGSPDLGQDYTYSAFESLWDKTSGIGTFGPTKGDQPYIYYNDAGETDKEVYVEWATSGRGNLNQQVHRFGLNDRVYLAYICTNNNSAGTPDRIQLYVDGVARGDMYYLAGKWNGTSPVVGLRYRVEGTTIKAKAWLLTDAEPDWLITYDASAVGYSAEGSRAYWKSGASSYFGTEGPWTYYWDHLRIFSLRSPPIQVDAYIYILVVTDTFTVDAYIRDHFKADAFVQPYLRVDAHIYYAYLRYGDFLLRALIKPPTVNGSLTADAAIVARVSFPAEAWLSHIVTEASITADALRHEQATGSFTADAEYGYALFYVYGIVGTKVVRQDYLVVRAWVSDDAIRIEGQPVPLDAYIESDVGEQWTIDAVVIGTERLASFTADATWAAAGEVRGQTVVDATVGLTTSDIFVVRATIEQAIFHVEAWLSDTLTVDAVLAYDAGSGSFTTDSWFAAVIERQMRADAVVVDGAGDYRGFHAEATILGTVWDERLQFFEALARIVGTPEASFTVDYVLAGALTAEAYVQPWFSVGAYVETTNVVVYPPEQEGDGGVTTGTAQSGSDGVAVTGTTFQSASADFTGLAGATIIIDGGVYTIASVTNSTTIVISGGTISGSGLDWYIPTFSDPEASFSDDDVGGTIVIEGITYTIIEVVDENTVIVGGSDEWPTANGGLDWYVPSGDPTDPVGDSAPITRTFNVMIEWRRPDRGAWTDLTGDVVWRTANFTQSARVGPGTFEMSLIGAHSQFIGGEEVRVSVDGFVVFGGYVTDVMRGYVFEDSSNVATVTLRGTDYNALLDRLLIYNAEWDEKKEGSGPYRTWKPFAKGTLDRTIITTVARRFMTDPDLMGLDMTTYVDEIETPAPTTGFQMESGMSLRNLLTEISRITEGVWWIDPYKNLHYHDRAVVSAPYPITDTAGGIACRGLKVQESLSVMSNDVFVWGTQAYMDTGDSDIIYSRQTADRDWDVEWWTTKLSRVQNRIDAIRAIPYGQRTLKQRTTLAALRETKRRYERKLAAAQASVEEGSLETYKRWQYGEFRSDIYQQGKVDRRARAIMQRYSEPVVKGIATVFEAGFQAGQVATVVSNRHEVAEDLVIRELTLSFVVSKEPIDGRYYAVPRYALKFGLDPEEPWNIYQFLPYPDPSDDNTHYNPPRIYWVDPPIDDYGPIYLDTFSRIYASETDLGTANSERIEIRNWGPDE